MSSIRWLIGHSLLFFSWVISPRKGQRSGEHQKRVDREMQNYALYEYKACPYCILVRREIQRLNLPIQRRDTLTNYYLEQDLLKMGGKTQVPCLMIGKTDQNSQWIYNSKDIITHLRKNFPLEKSSQTS